MPEGTTTSTETSATPPTSTPTTAETQSTPSTTSTTSTQPSATVGDTSLLSADAPVEADPATAEKVVPEAYADFNAPEGRALDKSIIEKATPIFKELGLDQAGAQKLVDFFLEHEPNTITKLQESNRETRTQWREDSNKWMNSNGGDKQVKAEVGRALNQIFQNADGTPDEAAKGEFRKFMDWTYAGDNPYFIRAFATMAKSFGEGTSVQGSGPSKFGQQAPGADRRPSLADSIYPGGPRTERYIPPPGSPQGG